MNGLWSKEGLSCSRYSVGMSFNRVVFTRWIKLVSPVLLSPGSESKDHLCSLSSSWFVTTSSILKKFKIRLWHDSSFAPRHCSSQTKSPFSAIFYFKSYTLPNKNFISFSEFLTRAASLFCVIVFASTVQISTKLAISSNSWLSRSLIIHNRACSSVCQSWSVANNLKTNSKS